MANTYLRVGTQWRPVGEEIAEPNGPPPPPPPPPTDWQTAIDTRSLSAVRTWYEANTGHEALGLSRSDLTSGSLVSEHDGQVFEGILASHIRIGHRNVVIRGCRVENGALYGTYFNPTFGATGATGCRIEYTTVAHPSATTDQRHACILLPGNVTDSVTISRCNIWGWTSAGCRAGNGVTMEYSWVHDFQHPPGLHANSGRLAGHNCTIRRNYMTDGRSGVCSIYFDENPIFNAVMQENILTGESPGASPSYLINLKSGDQGPVASNVKIIGNQFGPGYQFGLLSGANVPWGQSGNEISGNQWFTTGEPMANN